MKKLFYILIFLILLFQVNASICQDTIISGEDCLMVTPELSCSVYSYLVLNNVGGQVEVGSLTYYGNGTYYFNFVLGKGEYLVKLCDGTTREVYVVDDVSGEDMSYPVTSLYGIVFLFLIIIGVSIFLFFYNKDDMWLQALSFLLGFVTFIFLIVISIDINDIQNNYSTGFSRFVVGDTDFNSGNVSYFLINDSDRYLLQFNGFNDVDVEKFDLARLCFKYNNSDGANSLAIYNFNSRVSEKQLISSSLIGEVCVDFKPSKVFNGVYLGVGCDDCVIGNSMGLGVDLDASLVDVSRVKVNQSYSIVSMNPFLYEVRVRYPPFDSVRSLFFYYLWVMGFFVLAFGARAIIMLIVKVEEVAEK